MPFRSLGLSDRILRATHDAGYTEPTPIQAAAIPLVLAGHDLIGIAQTGTGKTAAFTLPLLDRLAALAADAPHHSLRGIRALILAPTRELVVQIEENVRAYAKHVPLRLALVYGGVGERPQIQALRFAHIVIATPGRLLDLMGRSHADFSALECLVLDEADRMLDMGFLPDIRRVVRALPQKRQTLLFSATLSREIEGLTHEFLRTPKMVQIGRRSNPAETVTQIVFEVSQHQKTSLLTHLLRDPSLNMVLVFARTKHGADRIARQLELRGIPTATLHSNRSQNQRLRALKDFKSGAVRVLVATDIASRGIDVDGISHVVNYDFPRHVEDYVHRIGRTGRAQAVGDAISFVSAEDHGHLRSLERFIGRGLVRKRAEGLDSSPHQLAAPLPQGAAPRPQQHSRPHPLPERHGPRHPQGEHRAHAPQRPAPAHAHAAVRKSPGPRRPFGGQPEQRSTEHPKPRGWHQRRRWAR